MTTAQDNRARRNEHARAWRVANPDKVRQYRRAYQAANIEKVREWDAARRARDREKISQQRRARYAANPLKFRDRGRAWYENNLDKAREHSRNATRRKKKLPTPTRAAPSHCECCGSPPGKKALAIDHCHATGMFRGWLCTNCNTGIGSLGDNLEGAMRAVRYLSLAEGQK